LTEITLSLSGIDPLQLFGVNNARLRLIETTFADLRMVARGDEFRIAGEAEHVQRCQAIVEALLAEIRRSPTLSQYRFEELLMQHKDQEPLLFDLPDDAPILHGIHGNPIKAKTKGQRAIVKASRENDIIFATGPAGTGKSYVAVALAVRALKNREVKKIVLCRPAVDAGESLGFLPGDMKEKVDPYMRPLYDALEDMIHADKLKYSMENNVIEIAPLAFMRGRTLSNAYIILDEAQNATEMQMKMFLTRLGENSRMFITGDTSQIDLPRNQRSGLVQCLHMLRDIPGIAMIHMSGSDVVRHRLVRAILTAYEENEPERPGR
jgi:phosphate starvation-inducible PhoH-like protein